MTIRVTYNQTCDRCERPFDQKILKSGATVPKIKSKGIFVYATTTEEGETTLAKTPLAGFEDLCDGCRDAVQKLVDKIQLSTKRKSKPRMPKASKVKEPAPESDVSNATTDAIAADKAAKAAADESPKDVDETGEPVPHPEDDGKAVTKGAEPEPAAKPKRKRRTKKEMEAARAAEAAEKAAKEAAAEAEKTPEEYSEDDDGLGLAGDGNAKAREAAGEDDGIHEEAAPSAPEGAEEEADPDDPFPGREVFEDPSTGDIIDVHSGEVLAKREDGGEPAEAGAHPF